MEQFLHNCFSWPTLPASLLLLAVCFYWLLMIFGAVGLDFLDIDLDLDMDADVDVDVSILQLGFVPLRHLNIGAVPTMLWLSVFALAGWVTARLWNSPLPHDTFQWSADSMAILRNAGVAVMLTKLITQPLRGRFDPVEPNKAESLVGQTCTITTTEVNEQFGEASLATDGAPLRLKVRNSTDTLQKGDSAVIVNFETEGNLYFVEPAPLDNATGSELPQTESLNDAR